MNKDVAGQSVHAGLIQPDGMAFTGTVTVYVTLDGNSQGTGAGTVENEGNGQYTYKPTQAETNADSIGFLFTGSGALSRHVQVFTRP